MFKALIISKSNIKLLLNFFLDDNGEAYWRNFETVFDRLSNAIHIELNHFEKAGLLVSSVSGSSKWYQLNNKSNFLFVQLTYLTCTFIEEAEIG